jgi:hypothetical protein
MIVAQRTIGEDPAKRLASLPRARAYLRRHDAALAARRSRVYRGRPPYTVFGVGDYTFAKWKVAVSGLHDDLRFRALGSLDGRPIVPNDTVYFLPFRTRRAADATARFLNGPDAQAFYRAFIFPEAKRPVTAAILGKLALAPAPA